MAQLFIQLLIFILVTFGLTHGLMTFPFPQKVKKYLTCYTCLSFWVGLGLAHWLGVTEFIVFDALIVSGTTYIISELLYNKVNGKTN